jgi:hypothetical protein
MPHCHPKSQTPQSTRAVWTPLWLVGGDLAAYFGFFLIQAWVWLLTCRNFLMKVFIIGSVLEEVKSWYFLKACIPSRLRVPHLGPLQVIIIK